MIGVTYRHVVDDLIVDFKQTFDDKQITRTQMLYWVLVISDRLRSQHIPKRSSGAFLSTFILPLEVHTTNKNSNEVKNRKFFRLPQQIYDFDNDGGIAFVAPYNIKEKLGDRPEFTRNMLTRTTQAKSETLYYTEYEKPSASNAYYYRIHDHIYTLGFECVNIEFLEVGLYMTLNPITNVDIDDVFDFPAELIAILKRQVLDLGRFALLLPEERINDGKSDNGNSKIPTNKIASVNDLNAEA